MALRVIRPNYLPQGFDERNVWLQNFAAVLPQYAAALGVAAADVSKVADASQQYNYLATVLIPYTRSFSKGLTALLEEADTDDTPQLLNFPGFAPPPAVIGANPVMTGIFNMVTALVASTILPSPALTPPIKTALGLDVPAPAPPGQVLVRSAEAMPGGQVDLTLTRSGAPLIIIESQRGAETEFSMLDKVAASHFLDLRPNIVAGQSEVRQYRVRRSDGSQAVGNYSPVVSVATQV